MNVYMKWTIFFAINKETGEIVCFYKKLSRLPHIGNREMYQYISVACNNYISNFCVMRTTMFKDILIDTVDMYEIDENTKVKMNILI